MTEQLNEPKPKVPASRKRKIFRGIKLAILIYGVIGIVLYYMQDKFLFHPKPVDQLADYHFNQPYEDINLAININENLNIIHFKSKDSLKKGSVIYFHGNVENVAHYAKYAAHFTNMGYDVWMPDYPGFGKTNGERTERKMYDQALLVYKMVRSKIKSDSIILYGKSLGTGVASWLASRDSCKMLILETPYYSIPALFSTWAPIYPTGSMSHYKFPVNEYLPDIAAPIIILHGKTDGVISYRCAFKLKPLLKSKDEFITIEGGSHNDLAEFPLFYQKIDSLLR